MVFSRIHTHIYIERVRERDLFMGSGHFLYIVPELVWDFYARKRLSCGFRVQAHELTWGCE